MPNGSLVDDYVDTHKKDQLVGFMLTLVFGPLGLFYSSWVIALILVVVLFLLGPFAGVVIGFFVIWPLSMLVSWAAISDYNEKVKARARLIAAGRG